MARYALKYPFRSGVAASADDVFRGGGDPPLRAGATTLLRSTTVFRHGDDVVRVFDIDGSLEEAIEMMVRAAELQQVGRALDGLLEPGHDLTSPLGLRRFFTENLMVTVTERSAPVPVEVAT